MSGAIAISGFASTVIAADVNNALDMFLISWLSILSSAGSPPSSYRIAQGHEVEVANLEWGDDDRPRRLCWVTQRRKRMEHALGDTQLLHTVQQDQHILLEQKVLDRFADLPVLDEPEP